MVTALRSFLRFLQERGLLATDLAAAVPGVAGWRLSHLPKALPAEQVERLLAPRLHDLRHRLAVTTLLRWYHDGVDVERHLPELATCLGHSHITDTYWYLTATPELLQQALLRFEKSQAEARP